MKLFAKVLILFVSNLSFIFSSASAEEKMLVVFYSSTGNTKAVCEVISKELGTDLIEIKDLKNDSETIQKAVLGEMKKLKKGEGSEGMKGNVPPVPKLVMDTDISPSKIDFSLYSRILIGSPIWMGKLAPAVNKLLGTYRLDNKKIVLLTTSNAVEPFPRHGAYKNAVKKSGADLAAYYQVQVKNDQKADLTREEILYEAGKIIPAIKFVFN